MTTAEESYNFDPWEATQGIYCHDVLIGIRMEEGKSSVCYEDDASLTDEECERKWFFDAIIMDGYYDPFRIDQADIAGLMILKGIVSEKDAYSHDFIEQDKMKLANVPENDWDNLDDYSKVVYHVIINTANLPKWRRPYLPSREFLDGLKEFLNMDPRLTKI